MEYVTGYAAGERAIKLNVNPVSLAGIGQFNDVVSCGIASRRRKSPAEAMSGAVRGRIWFRASWAWRGWRRSARTFLSRKFAKGSSVESGLCLSPLAQCLARRSCRQSLRCGAVKCWNSGKVGSVAGTA